MNYDHIARHEAITGMSGTGKTTLYLELFRKWPAKYKFAFDRKREVARKLKLKSCVTAEQMVFCVKRGYPVLYDSSQMFPGDAPAGFAFFTRWTYEVCKCIRATKLIGCDEIQFAVPHRKNAPKAIGEIMDDGRKEEIDFLCVVNKGYHKLNEEIRGQLTKLYIFRTEDYLPLRKLAQDGVDIEKVKILAMPDKAKNKAGEYIIKGEQ